MKILVTGAAGFVGSHLVERLLAEGNSVVGLDNFDTFYDPRIKRQNIREAIAHPAYRLVEGDLRDADTLTRCFASQSIDTVIHLAARAGVRPSLVDPELYYDVNVMGTLKLLEAMRHAHCSRLLFASSSSVYGNNSQVPFAETDNVDNPISPYAATKKAGELLCYTFHHLYGFDVACLRFFTVYGPRQRPEMAIHSFIRKISHGEAIPVYGDGTTRRDYTFIADILDGIQGIMHHLKGYDIVNLGESRTVELQELIGVIEKSVGKKAIVDRKPMQPGDVQQTFADISHARSRYGYNPRFPIEKGIEEAVTWFTQQGLL